VVGSPPVLVVGEALVDVVHRVGDASGESVTEHPGGSPANVAVTLGRREVPTELFTCLGTDPHGELIRQWLAESGVRVLGGPAARTATATARIATDGSASYEFDISWEPSGVSGAGHGIVHTGSIAGYLGPGATFVRDLVAARADEAVITYDPNVRPSLIEDRESVLRCVDRLVRLSDIVKASDEDLAWIAPDTDPLDMADRWLEVGPRLVVITFGARGSVARTVEGVQVRHRADVADVADTVGAGDSFMGALIAWLFDHGITGPEGTDRLRALNRDHVTDLVEVATRAAAVTVSRPGADPPWSHEID
jgi:fructokinase